MVAGSSPQAASSGRGWDGEASATMREKPCQWPSLCSRPACTRTVRLGQSGLAASTVARTEVSTMAPLMEAKLTR